MWLPSQRRYNEGRAACCNENDNASAVVSLTLSGRRDIADNAVTLAASAIIGAVLEVASIQMNEDDVVDGERSNSAYLNPLLCRR